MAIHGSYTCGYHTGADIPSSGAGGGNPELYSCVEDGKVIYVYKDSTGSSPALGNQVQIKDNQTGNYYRYCHMQYGTIAVNIGDHVTTSTYLGNMGTTGNSTGVHLHLELSTSQSWQCGNFLDPLAPLGIPNERGTIVEYDGTITPPKPPEPTIKSNNSLKWLKARGFKLSIKF